MPIYPKPSKLLLVASMLTLPSLGFAQLNFTFSSAKAGFQASPNFVTYDGGSLQVSITDGSFTQAVCLFANPGPFFVPQNTLGCAAGTTSQIFGANNASGLSGFWSLAAPPVAAQTLMAGRGDLVTVIAAPVSLLERPQLSPVLDNGVSIFHNIITGNVSTFSIAGYSHTQAFAATPADRERHDETLPHGEGSYIFGFPGAQTLAQQQAGLNPPTIPVAVDSASMPESYPGVSKSPIEQGFRFLNGQERLNGTMRDGFWNDGMLELDPFLLNSIEWEGLNFGQNFGANDSLRFWALTGRTANPLVNPTNFEARYPTTGFFTAINVPIANLVAGFVDLPPLFFTVGEEVVFYMRMDRNITSTAIIRDTSYRVWALPIRFVETYDGFALTSLPATATAAETAPDADFDGDGFSNFLEYAANSDPNDVADIPSDPNFPNLVASLTDDGRITATVEKNVDAGGALIYDLEWSSDMVNFTSIDKEDDPIWDVVETAEELTVTAQVAGDPPVAFIRARVSLRR